MAAKTYTVSDGTLMLTLEVAEEGGYCVTSPLDPQLNTQAETLEEAFENAYDAQELLIQVRARMAHAYLMANMAQVDSNVRAVQEGRPIEQVVPVGEFSEPPVPTPAGAR